MASGSKSPDAGAKKAAGARRLQLGLLAALLPWAVSSLAHHSHASLNQEDRRVMQGVVSAYLWRSPHIYNPESIKGWPLTERGRRQVESFSEEANPLNQCIVNGPPRAMLTRPVTLTHQWRKIRDSEIVHAECSLENANFFLRAGYN